MKFENIYCYQDGGKCGRFNLDIKTVKITFIEFSTFVVLVGSPNDSGKIYSLDFILTQKDSDLKLQFNVNLAKHQKHKLQKLLSKKFITTSIKSFCNSTDIYMNMIEKENNKIFDREPSLLYGFRSVYVQEIEL